MIGALNYYFALGSLSDFGRSYLTFDIDGFLDEAASILLDQHQLDYIKLFILYPVFIEFF